MSAFTPAEIEYLRSQQLGRLATVNESVQPHVVPVSFRYNAELDAIDVGGHNLRASKKFRDAAKSGRAAFVVDAVLPPWQARGVEVRGRAEVFSEGGEEVNSGFGAELIRIVPSRIVGWGIDTDPYSPNSRSVGRTARRGKPDRTSIRGKEVAMNTTNNASQVAQRAWEAWKHDVETGDPEPFIAMMTDDYTFMFPNPTERFRGQLYGKEEYRASSRWRWNDLKMRAKLDLDRVTGTGNTYAFEWSIVSENRSQPYTNHMCIFFDVHGDKVSAHREYVNELDPQAVMNGAVEPSDAPPRRRP